MSYRVKNHFWEIPSKKSRSLFVSINAYRSRSELKLPVSTRLHKSIQHGRYEKKVIKSPLIVSPTGISLFLKIHGKMTHGSTIKYCAYFLTCQVCWLSHSYGNSYSLIFYSIGRDWLHKFNYLTRLQVGYFDVFGKNISSYFSITLNKY